MAVRIGLNGFGRIGRNLFRASINEPGLEFVAINDITDAATLAHLLRYDSVHGRLEADITAEPDALIVNDKRIQVCQERNPADLPWEALGVEVALECTGLFTDRDKAARHLSAGAKKVLISAPAKGADLTLCYGVNHASYDPASHHIISNASCTTNCLSPVAKVLHETFGVKRGLMTTVHAYTNDQRILDLPHSDIRRARAAAQSMIPTSTGAARARSAKSCPNSRASSTAWPFGFPRPMYRWSTWSPNSTRRPAPKRSIRPCRRRPKARSRASSSTVRRSWFRSISTANPHSSIFDAALTKVMDNNFVKVLSWYDNEWGFSNRMRDVSLYIGQSLS